MTQTVPDLAPLTPGARRVLDAASELFYDRGIHAVGVDTIAEAAGVTKKTLYDRFGSKEALVIAYLQHRDARWRAQVDAALAQTPEPGVDRVLAIFDAAIAWTDENGRKGCAAINARAEIGENGDAHAVLPEVARQKAWLFRLFVDLCAEAGIREPRAMAESMMLLYDGALVTVGMATFADPLLVARDLAREILARG